MTQRRTAAIVLCALLLTLSLLYAGVAAFAHPSSQGSSAIGGSGFTLRVDPSAVALSWQPGTVQTGYLLLRSFPQSSLALLPSSTAPLAGSATSYRDTSPFAGPAYCYVLLPVGGDPPSLNQVLGLSDLLCLFPGTQAGAAPGSFSVRLDQSPLVSLSWTAPGGQDSYMLRASRFDGSADRLLPVAAGQSAFQEDIGSLTTCYQLTARATGLELGHTTTLCAIPGISTLPANPPPTITPAASPTPTAPGGSPGPSASPTRTATGGPVLTVTPGLPTDPASVAPPLDRSVAIDFASAVTFLHAGPNPVQIGVAPATIDPHRAAVLRGKVMTRDGSSLSGVIVTILNHPEFGQTQSRADGHFDLVVNGGGPLNVSYFKTDFLIAHRQINTPWRDYALLPDVVLVPPDSAVTTILLGVAALDTATPGSCQVHQSSPVTDADGTRRSTVIFPPGLQASMTLPDGSTLPLSNLGVHSTELSVGPNGSQALPGTLPPTTAYGYASALSIDEATAAGAREVSFSQPVVQYSANLLNLPVGSSVPLGSYDAAKGQWMPAGQGLIVKTLATTGGLANLDLDGSGQPASPAALAAHGVTDCERKKLADTFPPLSPLQREPIDEVDPGSPGIVTGLGDDPDGISQFATQPDPVTDRPLDDPCHKTGSDIECENQVLEETVDVVGTPYSLKYTSDRVPGRAADRTLTVTLTGTGVPSGLQRIELEVLIAGQRFSQSFTPAPSLRTTVSWDGKDAYGRLVQGAQPVTLHLDYLYNASYVGAERFGAYPSGVPISGTHTRELLRRRQTQQFTVQPWDARAQGLGGWALSAHHVYDPVGRVLYDGDGSVRSLQGTDPIITTVAGTGATCPFPGCYGGDGGPATAAQLNEPADVAVGPDGSLYIADESNSRVRRVGPDGVMTTVAGNGAPCLQSQSTCSSGDGGPATQAQLQFVNSVALGPEGSLYVSDALPNGIRRVDPSGIITTVAGGLPCDPNSNACYNGDGIPAAQAQLSSVGGIAVGTDGSLYIADNGNNRVRRVGPDGTITTVAGDGTNAYSGDGGPATQAKLRGPTDVALGPNGSLFIAESNRVRRVDANGIITTAAGTGVCCETGDGSTANLAAVSVGSLTVGPDGSFYIAGGFNTVRQVGTDRPVGLINPVTLNPCNPIVPSCGTPLRGAGGDGGPAGQARLADPHGLAIGPDQNLYIADLRNDSIRRVAQALPGYTGAEIHIPSEDGVELYEFDALGRHLRTRHALTGAMLLQFGYDSTGRLSQVTDGDGNVTTIEHDGPGNPTGITGPFGKHTTLTTDANGFLSSVANPAGNTVQLTSSSDGLLATMTDPRGNVHRFTYDALGRLTKDENPAAGSTSLTRTDTFNAFNTPNYNVALATGLNRTSTYQVQQLNTLATRRTITDTSGLQTVEDNNTDGTWKVTNPGGMITTRTDGPDPRFGMLAPITKSATLTTPGALTYSVTSARSATLTDPANPLSLTAQNESVAINGRTYTSAYDAASRTFADTTPAGRQSTTMIDTLGRIVQAQIAGLFPSTSTYDNRGRPATDTDGGGPDARTSTYGYGADGFLQTITDALGRTTSFARDAAGRVTQQTLPDDRVIGFTYDASGNLTSITPPGRPAHTFSYSPVDLLASYTPPGAGGTSTQYTYNGDRDLTRITQPDGQTVNLGYDAGGRMSTTTIARGQISYAYHPTTGNLAGITAPGGLGLAYTYDGALPIGATWSGAVAGSVTRAYDNSFRVVSESVNGANAVTFAYDQDSLLTQAGSLVLSRNAQNGLLTRTTLGAITDALTYDGFGEPTSYSASASGSGLLGQQLSYDKLGRITQKIETIGGAPDTYSYTYGLTGRLTGVTKNGASSATYTYDSNGNRLSRVTPGGTTTGAYDDQDRLTQYGAATYAYTANGELLSKTSGAQTTNYQYDELGNLLHVAPPSGPAIDYVIDGENRRIGKRVGSTLQQGFLYDGQLHIVAELDGSNQIVSRFVYASHTNVPEYMVKAGVTYRIITDHLGSPRLVANTTTGAIAQRLDYDELGNVLQDTAPGFQPFGFAGGLYDHDTKLVRFGTRDYDPETGRWTTKDPILFAGLQSNLYSYANGDPINVLDPTGLSASCPNEKALKRLAKKVNEILTRLDQGVIPSEKDLKTITDFLRAVGRDDFASRVEFAIDRAGYHALTGWARSGIQATAADPDPFRWALRDDYSEQLRRWNDEWEERRRERSTWNRLTATEGLSRQAAILNQVNDPLGPNLK